jgi:hypothetical protein
MGFFLSFNAVLQVIAAFVIFLLGYVGLFVFLILCLLIATGVYEGVMAIRARTVTSASTNNSVPLDGNAPVRVPALARPASA